jgi:CubicO group peptidase (beta-lactamase class C family)
LGRFFQDEIAKPLGLEFYIGLPVQVPDSRIAKWQFPSPFDYFFRTNKISRPFLRSVLHRKSLAARFVAQSRNFDPRNRAFLALENPAFTGVGLVRSIAHAYSVFATGGHELGILPRTLAALTAPPVPPKLGTHDEMIQIDVAFSLGYMRAYSGIQFGTSDKAFGTAGAGGSFGFADPDAQVGYAYAPSRMGMYLFDDPREKVLRDTFYQCLEKLPNAVRKQPDY